MPAGHTPSSEDLSEIARQREILAACERLEHDWRQGTAREPEAYVSGLLPPLRADVLEALAELLSELQSQSLASRHEAATGRFEIVRPLASGGMGVVFEAHDRELRRTVALKEILPAGADDEAYRQRFLAEAEITGRLEHPGVIPVYSRGTQPDGRPYYAMRLISGAPSGTLQDALREFHAAPPADPTERDLAWRGLLRRIIDVCNTMAYAHSQEVLHRDLKPANILLGPYGETLVVDWGLAKDLRTPQPADGAGASPVMNSPVTNPPLVNTPQANTPSASPDRAGTSGSATRGVGTLGHASPEQLQGARNSPGPESDIYSLGTILYSVLTGQSPFSTDRSTTPSGVLQKVCAGDFAPPRQLNPRVDRGLEAICLKAMAREPAGRYSSATDLASDLERHLAGEAVTAWREPWSVRARRWIGRHRTLVTSLAVGLSLTTLASTLVALLQAQNRQALTIEAAKLSAALDESQTQQQRAEQERQRATHAQGRAEIERNRAIEGENLAVQAVDEFRQALVGHPELVTLPQFASLRADLLKKPLAFYQQLRDRLAALPEPSLANLEALRKATTELAAVQAEIGDLSAATRHYESLLDFCEQTRQRPELQEAAVRKSWQLAQVDTRLALGRICAQTGDATAELGHYERALEELDDLAETKPLDSQCDALRALALGGAGEALSRLGQISAAHAKYTQSIRLQRVNIERNPQTPLLQRNLAVLLLNDARLLDQLNQPAEAETARHNASRLLEALGETATADRHHRHRTAAAHFNRGFQANKAGDLNAAGKAYRQAVAEWESLAREYPAHNEYLHALRQAQANLTNLLIQLQQWDEGLPVFQQLVQTDLLLVQKNPEVADYRRQLLESQHNLGHLCVSRGREAEADACYPIALEQAEWLLARQPGERRWQRQVVELGIHLADLRFVSGDVPQARARLEAARPLALSLVETEPVEAVDRHMWHVLGSALADFVEFQGEGEAAVRIRRQMLEWDQRNPVLQTLDQRVQEVLAGGAAQSPAEQLQLARRLAEQMQYEAAFKLCTAALEAEPSLVEDRQLQPRWLAASLAMRVAASALPEEDGTRASTLRQQALQWLQEELETWRASGPDWRITRNSALRRWRSDASFAPVLHPDRLARLPEAEQQAWRHLFAAAAQLADSPPAP